MIIKINNAITDILNLARMNELEQMQQVYDEVININNIPQVKAVQELPVDVNKEITQTV